MFGRRQAGPRVGLLQRLMSAMIIAGRGLNIEWHIIPSTAPGGVPTMRISRGCMRDGRATSTGCPTRRTSVHQMLMASHRQVQGRSSASDDAKRFASAELPAVLRDQYGLDLTCDSLRGYIERRTRVRPAIHGRGFAYAGITPTLGAAIHADWTGRGLIPAGYQLFVCPPTVFNLVGMLFHREWSETPTLELSAYRDERGNGFGLAVGSNEPGDFSHARRLETDPDLRLLGFRMTLVAANVAAGSTEGGKASR